MSASRKPRAASGATPPSGTVTFAFTDIEGSTARWERAPEEMNAALRRHDALVRAAVEAHGGHVFKTVGDAFCTAFARPLDALGAMIAVQRALSAEDFTAVDGIRVRCAIHSGSSDERDGDYFGPTVNRVARLLAIASAGHILVSGATNALVGVALPEASTLRDLGEHRLKDLSRSERVFQLLAPGLENAIAPLRSPDARPNNLPLQITSLVGREAEVADISALLASHRLVTIVGPGGIGKTRISLLVGASAADAMTDGIWFVELAPLADGAYVAPAIAQAMRVSLAEGDPLAALVAALATKRALLVFDNCEHLVDAAARTIAAILHACPHVAVLATTRRSLGIAGEAVYRLASLAVAEATATTTALEAARSPAIALFVERAAAIDRRFVLTDDNVVSVADVCRRLDGIPLAIELAAARVTIFTPRRLSAHLDERFRLLTGGGRDVLPRQRTLRALIDWSHDLLDERERSLFRRLAIFANGFTLEGAVAVAGGDADEIDVSLRLESLVNQSLVIAGADERYRLLESTRAYALERLDAATERHATATHRTRYLRDTFVAIRARWEHGGTAIEIGARLVSELDDLRAALDGMDGDEELALVAELLAAIDARWDRIGLRREAEARIARVVARLPPDRLRVRSRLWDTLSNFAWVEFRAADALHAALEAVRLGREDGDPSTLAAALTTYAGSLTRSASYDEASAVLDEAEGLVPADNRLLRNRYLEARAMAASFSGELDVAVRAYHEMLRAQETLGDVSVVATLRVSLAEIEHRRGRTLDAIDIARAALASPGLDLDLIFNILTNLCGYLLAVDRLEAARVTLRQAFALEREQAGIVDVCLVEAGALLAALAGDVSTAARVAAFTDAYMAEIGLVREHTERTTRDRLDDLLRADPSPANGASLIETDDSLTLRGAIEGIVRAADVACNPTAR